MPEESVKACSSHTDVTEASVLRFKNKSAKRVKANWVGFDGEEKTYAEVDPGHASPQRVEFCGVLASTAVSASPAAAVAEQEAGCHRQMP
ncbi:hypothetical protein TSOC_003194 [Tetrabaena socialis]|uniref:von Hippel-Lindau disease tumour suppressor beta domain-containing protein n=1 Tax=Tetrabaena socialis TaxID=47790 RepID=A0A2J8AC67_9CHLO|nr:hypothetical protein TSOC_003194 [Tetrabaena socialis]|eukprot:PNH10111.1 hypothetical protein TSOC_003194 [Tetrabaena socialis]